MLMDKARAIRLLDEAGEEMVGRGDMNDSEIAVHAIVHAAARHLEGTEFEHTTSPLLQVGVIFSIALQDLHQHFATTEYHTYDQACRERIAGDVQSPSVSRERLKELWK